MTQHREVSEKPTGSLPDLDNDIGPLWTAVGILLLLVYYLWPVWLVIIIALVLEFVVGIDVPVL